MSPQVFQALLGVLLLLSAGYFFIRPQEKSSIVAPSIVASLLAGAVIGFLSGVTGTGGGIFLTPLLMLAAWASSKQAAAVSAVFILCNSVAGLAGLIAAKGVVPNFVWQFGAAVVIGGLVGSGLGANRFHAPTIKRLLAAVLVVAGMKLLLL